MRNKFVIQSNAINGNETGCFLCWLPLIQNCWKWFGEFEVKAREKERTRKITKNKSKEREKPTTFIAHWEQKERMNEWNAKWKSTKRFRYSTLLSIIDVSTTLRHFFPSHLMKLIKVDLSLFYPKMPVKFSLTSPLHLRCLTRRTREKMESGGEGRRNQRTQVSKS